MDAGDTVLGFVYRWVGEFAKHFEFITVVCLERGAVELLPNVRVLSLGKEGEHSRGHYILNLFRYILRERRNYDAVLVHMNQEYVLLAGLLWKMLGKRIYMWRNHYAGSWLTDVAAKFCTKIFCTSRSSYTAKYKKTVLMPVGVDADAYKPQGGVLRTQRSVLFLARMAPAKRAHILLEALGELHKRHIDFRADFYGTPLPQDESYLTGIKKRLAELGLGQEARFFPGLPYAQGPKVYSAHEIFVNLSPSGMYDKTIFEASACECLVLASSLDFSKIVDGKFIFPQDDVKALADKLEALLSLPGEEKVRLGKEMRALAVEKHSLSELGKQIAKEINV